MASASSEAAAIRANKWYNRLQIEFGVSWQLHPGDLTPAKWAFAPEGHISWPGRRYDHKKQGRMPNAYTCLRCVDPAKPSMEREYVSRIFWLAGAVRVLGLDIGGGVMWMADPRRSGELS